MLLEYGDRITSPGGMFIYQVIGPCCQLFDREELPWLSCNRRGRFKQPSWNRIGRRFVSDRAVIKRASYCVQRIDESLPSPPSPKVIIYWKELSKEEVNWWYSKSPYLKKIYQGQETVKAA
ncbi:MAG TPA: hypothetical protein V6C63_07730 [Allocoleopsis sp.]